MFVARTLVRRVWIGSILIVTSLKLAVARIVPDVVEPGISPAVNPTIRTGRVLRLAFPEKNGSSARYGLEATGAFPFVRVVALAQRSVPVPVEVAAVPLTAKAMHKSAKSAKKRSRTITRRLQTDHEKPFCFPANSQSCLNCPTCCIVCGSCTSSASCTGTGCGTGFC